MQKKRLGKTEMMVTEVGFGGIPVARVDMEKAIATVHRALDLGINFIDTANAYADSEYKLGFALKGKREDVYIATKSTCREKYGLLKHIDNSLQQLQTDYIDLFQIHQVSKNEEIINLFKEDNAYEGALEAKKQGKVRHIGITSHRLEAAITLVKTGKFDTIQFPGNFIETDIFSKLLPEAQKKDMGVILMKPFGGGELKRADLCFKFLQQYPECIPIPGMSEPEEVEEVVSLYENKQSITEQDVKDMEVIKNELGDNFCRRCGYCEPCPEGVSIFVGMSIKRIALNYGPNYSSPWFLNAIENVDKCMECGLCETKCPYNLPIRETLKYNKRFYEELKKADND